MDETTIDRIRRDFPGCDTNQPDTQFRVHCLHCYHPSTDKPNFVFVTLNRLDVEKTYELYEIVF
jgi:hypothetical protein